MKQASGLLGTRGCPGLTISKPKKLKVRSNAARGKKKKAENKFHPFDTVQQLKHPPKPTSNAVLVPLETVLQVHTYLYHLCSCGNKWTHDQLEAVPQQTLEELQNYKTNTRCSMHMSQHFLQR